MGIPLSTCKLRRSEEQFLIDIVVARIPLWKGHLMNTTGKVALTQATLSAIPVHLSIVVCLSPWAVMCRVAWEVVCRPKELGGLAIIDLRRFGLALKLRWD